MDKFQRLPKGAPFSPSAEGVYRFLYPADGKRLAHTETVVGPVPSGVRCPKHYGKLQPHLVTKRFAQEHSLRYRIIWIENGN